MYSDYQEKNDSQNDLHILNNRKKIDDHFLNTTPNTRFAAIFYLLYIKKMLEL